MADTTAWAAAEPAHGALAFLLACREQGRSLALISGAAGTGKAMLMRRLLQETRDTPVAHLRNPTGDPLAFLDCLLNEFGFEAVESTTSELVRLISVYLQHELAKDRRVIIVVEDVQDYGPAVWDKIRDLALPGGRTTGPALFVLTSTAEFECAALTRFAAIYSLDATTRGVSRRGPVNDDVLEIYFEGHRVETSRLERRRTTIGRNAANDIQIAGPFVSRFHAVIAQDAGGARIIDLKSTNGTRVNGQPVTERYLRAGDAISIGGFVLRYDSAHRPEHDSSTPGGDRDSAKRNPRSSDGSV